MIKKTRLKFFYVISFMIFLIIFIFSSIIIFISYSSKEEEINKILEDNIYSYRTLRPSTSPNDYFNESRSFTVKLDSKNQFIGYKMSSIYSLEEVVSIINLILESESQSGDIGNLSYLVVLGQHQEKFVSVINVEIENENYKQIVLIIILTGGLISMCLIIFSWFLSYWIVSPAKNSFEKQKRFISEASHEFKTPLTIINSSIYLLEKDLDIKSKWLENIKQQTNKLTEMTLSLLTLSKVDENLKSEIENCDISKLILNEVLSYEALCFEKNKKLVYDIRESIFINCCRDDILKIISILLDNSIKYSDENETINVILYKKSSKIILKVSNKTNNLKEEEKDLMFERFYRSDEIRNSVNGFGLGLSILKSIIEKNNYKIKVELVDKVLTFVITLN